MERGSREARSLLGALALHGALLALTWLWATRVQQVVVALPPAPLPHFAADEIDIDWHSPEIAKAAALAELLPSVEQKTRRTRLDSPTEMRAPVAMGASTPAPEPLPAQPIEVAAHAPSVAPRAIDLGLSSEGWERWLPATRGEAGRAAPHAPRALFRMPRPSNNGGLQEGLEAQDRAHGMSSSGAVRRALLEASRIDRAPATGLARFQVTVLESGAVEVSLLDATAELDSWRAVATEAASRLRKTPPRVPLEREGVHLLVEISAENQLPNGLRQSQLTGPHMQLVAPKFRSTAEAQKKLQDLNPLAGEKGTSASGTPAISELPGVYVARQGKVCGYRVGLSALGPVLQGGCDLSNLAAKPTRIVHASVLEEAAF